MSKKPGHWLRSKSGTRVIAGILALLVVVLVAGFVFDWWGAVGDWLSGAAAGYWTAKPKTADGCVTTYQASDGSGPLGKACFRSAKLSPGYENCVDQLCYVQQLSDGLWLRNDEVTVFAP